MTIIYYHIIGTDPAGFDVDHYLGVVPPSERERLLKYRRWQDRYMSLAGKLLLLNACHDFHTGIDSLDNLQYGVNKKPYFDHSSFYFNITHSGNLVCCAASNEYELGIDAEEYRDIDTMEFYSFFTTDEQADLEQATNKLLAFYDLWTKKEALLKAAGTGLLTDLSKVQALESHGFVHGTRWHLCPVSLHEAYACHLASAGKITNPVIRYVSTRDWATTKVS